MKFYLLTSINYVTGISRFFPPVSHSGTFSLSPYIVTSHHHFYKHYFYSYHLTHFLLLLYNLKSKKDILKFFNLTFMTSQFLRSPGPLSHFVTNLKSLPPLTVWGNLWTAPYLKMIHLELTLISLKLLIKSTLLPSAKPLSFIINKI